RVSKTLESLLVGIKRHQPRDRDLDIDDRLGGNARDGRRSVVVDPQCDRAELRLQTRALNFELTRPIRIVRNNFDHRELTQDAAGIVPTYFARGRMIWPVAYCSMAWPIHPIVRPSANRISGAPAGSRRTRAAAASPKSTVGFSWVIASTAA